MAKTFPGRLPGISRIGYGFLRRALPAAAALCMLPALLCGCAGKSGAPVKTSSSSAPSSAVSSATAIASADAASADAASADATSAAASSDAVSSAVTSSAASSEDIPAAPAAGKIVCIDPGHQRKVDLTTEPEGPGSSVMKMKNPGGATGVATGMPEYHLNLLVALKLEGLLKAKGYTVVMTRQSDDADISNIGRAEVANDAKADIFVRIHADSADSASVRGASVQIPGSEHIADGALLSKSRALGQCLLTGLVGATGEKSRGLVERNDMTGFNWSRVPVVLVEMGFLSNPDEDRLMSGDDYQNKIAAGLAGGVENYFQRK